MYFRIIGSIEKTETIAAGSSIKEIARLRKYYGKGRWRKMKGFTTVEFSDGSISKAEVHWYEAHGRGKKEMKIKYLLK